MVKSIFLQDGEEIFVDDEDYEKLNKYKWYKGYSKNTKSILTHGHLDGKERTIVIYELIKPNSTQVVKNNDFRKSNLSDEDIHLYSPPRFNQKSKYKGVGWDGESGRWKVSMYLDGKQKNLGRYLNQEEAAAVYNRAVDKYRNGKGFKNIIGEDNRKVKRDYRTRKNQLNTRMEDPKNYRGVTARKDRFEAAKRINGHNFYFGTYKKPEQAALVFNKVVLYLYGEKAILNNVPTTDELKEFIENWEIPEKIRKLKED